MKRVLLVDDETDALEVLAWMIQDWGYAVEAYGGVEAAKRAAREFHPDVLVTDYLLGEDRTGVDLIRDLRERRAALPAILVTGLSSDRDFELGTLQNVAMLRKPFRSDALRMAIEQLAPSLPATFLGPDAPSRVPWPRAPLRR